MSPARLSMAASVAAALCLAADRGPAWLSEAVSAPTAKYDAKAPALVLLDEQRVTIDGSGKRTIVSRRAVKVLNQEGRTEARAVEYYRRGSSEVSGLQAWVVSASGQTKQLGKERVLDIAAVDNDIYSDVRAKVVTAGTEVMPDSIFAFEAVSEDKSIFTQFEWRFQERLPVMTSRFVLTVGAGWRVESVAFNTPKIEPAVSGGTYTWEMRNLPFIEAEPHGPPARGLAPGIGVTFFPPGSVKNAAGPSFSNWQEVSVFQQALAEGTGTPSDEMAAKTRALIANAKSDMEKIAAIGRHAQSINYIATATNLGRGGGYRPHAAADVFAKSYGDCKDKANLMRAMLKIAGIDSYLTAIYAGDRAHVRPEWPSPNQFNHMILGVKAPGEVSAASVIEHPVLGRLLFFDPTDDSIPAGYLPAHEQGSWALVIAGNNGALVRMPVTPPEANRVEREAEISISASGSADVKLRERAFGETAALLSRRNSRATPDESQRSVERWLARTVRAPEIQRVSATYSSGGEFERTLEYRAPVFAQIMQNRLMMVKPVAAPYNALSFPEAQRRYPVVLESELQSETIRVVVPGGFEIDEVPGGVKLETPYGKYSASYSVELGAVVVKRSLEVRASIVPPEQYAALRNFFSRVQGSFHAPMVFVKK